MSNSTGAIITNILFSSAELYMRSRAQNPDLFKSEDEKIQILLERIAEELKKPADYAQTWRP